MTCSQSAIDTNASYVQTTYPGRLYAPVTITITNRQFHTTWEIQFTVSGDPLGRTFTAGWNDCTVMWVPCPSIMGTNLYSSIQPPPAIGYSNTMYLDGTWLSNQGFHARPKWPLELSTDMEPVQTIPVFPMSLKLTGVEMVSGDYRLVEVDLLDPAQSGPAQSLVLDRNVPGTNVAVSLKQTAIESLRLPFNPDGAALGVAVEQLEKMIAAFKERLGLVQAPEDPDAH